MEHVHQSLAALLKVKVTGKLEDGQLEFLGRQIRLDGNNIALGVKPEYVRSVFSAFGWTDKDLEKVKPTSTQTLEPCTTLKTRSLRRNPSRPRRLGGLGLVLGRSGGSPRRGPTSLISTPCSPEDKHPQERYTRTP